MIPREERPQVLNIARGCTFSFTITLPEDYDLTNAQQIWITFSQNNKVILNIDINSLDITLNTIEATLTESQTLLFKEDVKGLSTFMQLRGKLEDGSTIVQEPWTRIRVLGILKDGKIK